MSRLVALLEALSPALGLHASAEDYVSFYPTTLSGAAGAVGGLQFGRGEVRSDEYRLAPEFDNGRCARTVYRR